MNDSRGEREVIADWVQALDRIAIRALGVGLVLLALFATTVQGQQTPDELTLDDAIGLAKANNPTFLSVANDQASANWQVREAWAQFVPSVTTNVNGTWQEAGQQRLGAIRCLGPTCGTVLVLPRESGQSVDIGRGLNFAKQILCLRTRLKSNGQWVIAAGHTLDHPCAVALGQALAQGLGNR